MVDAEGEGLRSCGSGMMPAESGKTLLTHAPRQELKRRIAEDDTNPDDVGSWEQAKAQTLSLLNSNGK